MGLAVVEQREERGDWLDVRLPSGVRVPSQLGDHLSHHVAMATVMVMGVVMVMW